MNTQTPTLKVFILNYFITIITGSLLIACLLESFDFLDRSDDIFRQMGAYAFVAFTLSLPYSIISGLILKLSSHESKMRTLQKTQIVFCLIYLCFPVFEIVQEYIRYNGEVRETTFAQFGVILLYAIIGTILTYFPIRKASIKRFID